MAGSKPRHATDIEGAGGTVYPPPLDEVVDGRFKRKLGDAFGLTDFGVNLTELAPGAASSHRHWHASEDEFVYIVSGEVTLLTDEGESVMTPGMITGFPAGEPIGHQLVNRGSETAVVLEVGSRRAGDAVEYPDVDMKLTKAGGQMTVTRKDGSAFQTGD
jgi:uncharacterized cupin superfamily protein